jgi:hypothetical protein
VPVFLAASARPKYTRQKVHIHVRISVQLLNGITGKLLAALNNEGSGNNQHGAGNEGNAEQPNNSEVGGIEEGEEDDFTRPVSLQHDKFKRRSVQRASSARELFKRSCLS